MRIPHHLSVFLKGMGMGAADVVPGVSGGTIAFITGIYDELLDSIKSVNPHAAMILMKQGPVSFWQFINGNFLVALISGIGLSFLSLAHLITYLLDAYPLMLWSFFFGLVVASGIYIARDIDFKCIMSVFMIFAGMAIAYIITSSQPAQVDPTHLKVFGAGAIAICAMILPGISGSFILVLLGLYGFILESVKALDIEVICYFLAGCVTGLLSFVHLLSWLLKNYRSIIIALLTGFLLGSLNALWPWKRVIEYYQTSKGLKPLLQENILPDQYASIVGQDAMLLPCLIMMLVGAILVLGLEKMTESKQT